MRRDKEDDKEPIGNEEIARSLEEARKFAVVASNEIVEKKAPLWRKFIKMRKGETKNSEYNAERILSLDPKFAGRLRFNAFTLDIECRDIEWKGTPEGRWTSWDDTDDMRLTYFAQMNDVDLTNTTCRKGAYHAAIRREVHPVREYFGNLAWDGKSRLETMLATYCGVENNAYAAEIGKRWMISAVARIMEPGCKADHVLVLEGEQGVGKSSFVQQLTPDIDWYSPGLRELGTKDSYIGVHGRMIVEIPELAAIRRSTNETVKDFLTIQTDDFRPPYALKNKKVPRQCVFIATTNSYEWLTDETGGRRYWPVRVKKVDLKSLVRDRNQLWAEAHALYRRGEQWHLPEHLVAMAEAEQKARMDQDAWQEVIEKWLRSQGDAPIAQEDVFREALQIPKERWDDRSSTRVARVLRTAGYANSRVRIGHHVVRRWVKPTKPERVDVDQLRTPRRGGFLD